MTDLRQAAQAALDTLDNAIDHLPKPYSTDCSNAATDLRAALAAQPVAQEPRVCWLVEEFSDSGNSTGRYMLDQNGLTITTDAQQARRFLGSRTATFRATDMREKWGTWWGPVSHVFRAAQPQQATEPAPEVDAAIALLHRMLEAPTNWITPAWKDAIRPVLAGLITQGRSVDAQPQQATAGPVLTDDEIVSALKSCEQEDHAQAGWVWRQRVKWCRAIEAAVIAKLGGAA